MEGPSIYQHPSTAVTKHIHKLITNRHAINSTNAMIFNRIKNEYEKSLKQWFPCQSIIWKL